MSLCVALYFDGKWLVCSDSRISITVNDNERYVINDNYKKIRMFGDKVIFISGILDIVEEIFLNINKDSKVEDIANLVKNNYEKYKNDSSDRRIEIGAYIFTFINNVPMYYQIHYQNGFVIQEQRAKNKELFSVGAYSDKILQYIINLSKNGVDIQKAILKGYEYVADEVVGGSLNWFLFSPDDKKCGSIKINDNKNLRQWNNYLKMKCNVDLLGNAYMNKLTAETAIINNSTFNYGAIVGSSININNRFLVDSNGNMTAKNGDFEGTIRASNIYGSYINGSTIEGGQIISNTKITVTTNLDVGQQIRLTGGSSQSIVFAGLGNITFDVDSRSILIAALNGVSVHGFLIANNGLSVYGDLEVNGKPVVTRNEFLDEIERLERMIEDLEDSLP